MLRIILASAVAAAALFATASLSPSSSLGVTISGPVAAHAGCTIKPYYRRDEVYVNLCDRENAWVK